MFGWLWRRLFGRKRKLPDITRESTSNPLIWDRNTESILYHRFRMLPQRVGASRGVGHRGRKLPATLMPEQANYLFNKRRRVETDKDMVYRDLASKGYVVGSACRYGGDFVVYDQHPSKCHSSHTVRVIPPDERTPCLDLAGFCRVQGAVLKTAVLASVDPTTKEPQYVSFKYNAQLSTAPTKKLERRISRIVTQAPQLRQTAARPPDERADDDASHDDDIIPLGRAETDFDAHREEDDDHRHDEARQLPSADEGLLPGSAESLFDGQHPEEDEYNVEEAEFDDGDVARRLTFTTVEATTEGHDRV